MARLIATTLFLIATTTSWVTPVFGKPEQTKIELSELPVQERCAAATLVAREILDVADLIKQARTVLKPDGHLRLFVSKHSEESSTLSIFERGDVCGDVRIAHTYSVHEPKVVVQFAAGSEDDLPGIQHDVIITKTVGVRRWEFSWTPGDDVWGCPALKSKGPEPRICPGSAHGGGGPPLPTLKVTMVKKATGEFDVERAVLELIVYGGVRPRETLK